MSENQQPGDGGASPALSQVQRYQNYVLEYEALDEEIDGLLSKYNGATEKMPDEEYQRYRELAHRRDYVYNQIRALENQIFDDDNG